MTAPVTVIGGAAGITAQFDDLIAFARLMQSGTDSVRDALEQLAAPSLRWSLEIGATHDPVGAREVSDELAAVTGELRAVQARTQSLASLLRASVRAYRGADDGVLGSIMHAFGDLALGAVRIMSGDAAGGGREVFSALPGLTDATTLFAGGLEGLFAELVPDGHAVLHDMGIDTRVAAETPPRDLAELVGGLALRNSGRAGEISVSFVVGADGVRRAIADIPGTKSWNPAPNDDVTSVGTDIRALTGRDTAYQDGIFMALEAAGVGADDDVMLVGHSEGGLVAVNAARSAARSGRFRITHVVTAGSPIGNLARGLPDEVQVLALENSADVVPHFDSATNPDRPNVTTVTVTDQHGSLGDNHDLTATYQPAAGAAEHSCDFSVDAFLQSARGFLDGATMQTHTYRITRAF